MSHLYVRSLFRRPRDGDEIHHILVGHRRAGAAGRIRHRAACQADDGEGEDRENGGDLAHRNSLGGSEARRLPASPRPAGAVGGALRLADPLAQVLVGDVAIADGAGGPQLHILVAVARTSTRGASTSGGTAPGASRRAQMRKPV